ncbi:MAG: formylglycine-generating enzyme family protein [Lentisphaerae bacterium]|nr:formylglycine-generating enzyme family protein [Lentisphaerota bacterium]
MADKEKLHSLMLGSLKIDFVWCRPDNFLMGCSEDEEGDSEDAPLHQVTITKGYWLATCQVTQAQYDTIAELAGNPLKPSKFDGENKPVERVTWVEAMKWCEALNEREKQEGRLPEGFEYRLPTEAEWEYACRAGTTTALNNGKTLTSADGECPNLDEVAWYDKNSDKETHDVGTKKPNNWGLYDMHGNVEEWCRDWYGEYPLDHAIDPTGPDYGRYHVCRGGNMGGMALGCSASARKGGNPNNRRCYRGFRLAMGPIIDTPILQQDPRARKAEGDNVCSDRPTQEELLQSRMQLEEELGVAAEYEDIVKAKATVAGSRNFTLEEPSIRMLWCPPGSFDMGSPEDESGRNTDEVLHKVTFSKGFWLGMYPITQEEYSLIADCAGLRARPATFGGLRRPVESVDWLSVERWCKELTLLEMIAGRLPDGYEYRLPTEAEWEYACRAGSTTPFNVQTEETVSGEESRTIFETAAWYKYNSGYKTHPVGERLANAWGFCDMHGNVREWCWDWHAPLTSDDATDPKGPEAGTLKVTRGGCYGDFARHCRSAHRGYADPVSCKANLGFRVALAPILH